MSEEKGKFIKKRFGKYLLLDHLVDGGMAKICRARFLGEQADKIVIIKMVQPQFSRDESYRKMFLDEIKVAFGLIHPNIAQTYDYGIEDGQLYTAMEYVDGKNLKEFLDKLKERKFVFPVQISVHIIAQACQGLHYAHTLTDKLTGKACNIIHRDISPHNIMITYDGGVKVIDFGIAKAATNTDATAAGTIKGKLSYLAPEYLEGTVLDPRYDEFALGITLWEMLCSRRLFKASNDIAVLKQIQICKIPPPSSINPNVPKELDEIVLKALSKDRNQRYKDCDQFNRALIKFLYSNYLDFNATDLAYFAKELFKEEIVEDRKKFVEFGKINLAPFIEDYKKGKSGQESSDKTSAGRKEHVVLDFGFEDDGFRSGDLSSITDITTKTKTKTTLDDRRRKEGLVLDKDKGSGKIGFKEGSIKSLSATKTGTGKTKTKTKTGTRAPAIKKDTRAHVVASPKKINKKLLAAVGIVGLVIVGNTIFPDLTQNLINKVNQFLPGKAKLQSRIPSSIEPGSEKSSPKGKTETVFGTIEIDNYKKYQQKIFINGKQKSYSIVDPIKMPLNKEIVLRIEEKGYKHFIKRFALTRPDTLNITIPKMSPQTYGFLTCSCAWLKGKLMFNLFGEDRVETIAKNMRPLAFPVSEAQQTVYLRKDGESYDRTLKLSFKQADKMIDLCEQIRD